MSNVLNNALNPGLVSVVMPAYNAADHISEAIKSLQDQVYSLWELWIVDDGSTDLTARIVSEFQDPRIRLLKQPNQGVSSARNHALDLVNGEFITFLDSDDLLPPNSLSIRVAYLNSNPQVHLVDGVMAWFQGPDRLIKRIHRPRNYVGPLLRPLSRLDSSIFALPFYMFRKSVLNGTRFNVRYTHCEDILFFLELSTENIVIYGSVSENVYLYRTGETSAMSQLAAMNYCLINLSQYICSMSNVDFWSKQVAKLKIAKIVFLQSLALKRPLSGIGSLLFTIC